MGQSSSGDAAANARQHAAVSHHRHEAAKVVANATEGTPDESWGQQQLYVAKNRAAAASFKARLYDK